MKVSGRKFRTKPKILRAAGIPLNGKTATGVLGNCVCVELAKSMPVPGQCTSLAERITTLCYGAYSMDASGVRGGLLRQSIIDETVIDPFPSLSTSVKSHPIALPLPN
jgi:hypothetical protein